MLHARFLFFVLFVTICTLVACSPAATPKDLILAHTKEVDGSKIALFDSVAYDKTLPPADTLFISLLSKYGVLADEYQDEPGCGNRLFYYGYFKVNNNYTGALFLQSICSGPGEIQLILAIMDNSGNITGALSVADLTHPAECNIEKTSRISGSKLVVAEKLDCAILDEADPDVGRTSIDSVTSFYEIDNKGKIQLKNKMTTKLVR